MKNGQKQPCSWGRKVETSNATPTKFFFCWFLSSKFSNDYFITFEIPRVSYKRPIAKRNISLLIPSICNQRSLTYLIGPIFSKCQNSQQILNETRENIYSMHINTTFLYMYHCFILFPVDFVVVHLFSSPVYLSDTDPLPCLDPPIVVFHRKYHMMILF
jgi:hypothetical protein